MENLIITAAVTGGEYVSRKDTPYVPKTVDDIVSEVVRSVEAGASMVHLHAKNPETGEAYSGDPNPILKEYIERIRERVDVVINVTTGGGRVGNPPDVWDRLVKEKCHLGEEMMSLNMGTINRWADHPTGDVFLNTVPMIERWCGYMREAGVKPEHEVYDTGMINTCRQLAEKKIVPEPLHIQLVMVGRTGFLPTMKTLIYSLDQIPVNLDLERLRSRQERDTNVHSSDDPRRPCPSRLRGQHIHPQRGTREEQRRPREEDHKHRKGTRKTNSRPERDEEDTRLKEAMKIPREMIQA